MFDIALYIVTVIIIVTAGGWCLDWIFSGTFDPIYAKDTKLEPGYREKTLTCHVCGETGTFSFSNVTKEVKCKRCGSFLSEKE